MKMNTVIRHTKQIVYALLVKTPQRLLPKAVKLRLLLRSGVIDAGWHRRVTDHVSKTPLELAEMIWADDRERVASPLFSADFYRSRHGFRGSPAEALLDYVLRGESLGKKPSEMFDPDFFRRFNPGAPERLSALGLYGQYWHQYPNVHPHFDTMWYAREYPEFADHGLSPLAHFIEEGIRSGKAPNAFLDPDWYLETYPDVKASGAPAALHFSMFGADELRNPGPDFDMALYASKHPDYRESGFDPLGHHLVMGRRSGADSSDLLIKPRELLPVKPRSESWRDAVSGMKIDIIIPVYRNLHETRKCIESVLASELSPRVKIQVRNDCSPEPEVTDWLRALARSDSRITLSENEKNLGFVGSVNRSMKISLERGVDAVLLLNSDTEVAGDWVTRLAWHAKAGSGVGTVTATSNNATICSWPELGENALPNGLDHKAMHALAARTNDGVAIDVPTGVGFCMMITTEALRAVGLFDEDAFGKGYGEENDFCMRASMHGYRHLLAQDVFVRHVGEVSFSISSAEGKARAGAVIAARYPSYNHLVAVHVGQDPGYLGRIRLVFAAWKASGRPVTALFTHHLGGGTERLVGSRVEKLNQEGHSVVVRPVAGHPNYLRMENSASFDAFDMTLSVREGSDLADLLQAIGVTGVEIHHVLGFSPALRDGLAKAGIAHDAFVHDYFTICPQVTLTTAQSDYCGEPGIRGCDACIAQRPAFGASDIQNWRARHAWSLQRACKVYAPSSDTAARIERYTGVHVDVLPHEPPIVIHHQKPVSRRITPSHPLRVGLIGMLAPHKGQYVVLNVLREVVAQDCPLTFELAGAVSFAAAELDEQMGSRFTSTGRYKESDLPDLLETLDPDIFWFPSTAPETYSYTLSAAMRTGKPIVASNHGAFTERLADYPLGRLYPAGASAGDIVSVLLDAVGQGASNDE